MNVEIDLWGIDIDLFDLLTLALAFGAIVVSTWTFRLDISQERGKETLNAFHLLQNEALDDIYGMTPEEIAKIAEDAGSPGYKDLSSKLARIESFCVGVSSKVYSKRIVQRMAGSYLVSIYGKLSPFIEKKKERGESDIDLEEIEKVIGSFRR